MPQQKKKICFAAGEFSPTIGGLSRSATRIAHMLRSSGYEMHIIVPVKGAVLPAVVAGEEENGLLMYRVPVGNDVLNSNGMGLIQAIRQLDSSLNFDLFHGFFLPMAYACCLGMNSISRPLITSIRGSDAKQWTETSMSNLLRLLLKKTSCLTSVNTALLTKVIKTSGSKVDAVFIKNSIGINQTKTWSFNRMTSGKIGTLGKFQQSKEINTLLDSYQAIATNLRSHLSLIGDFPNLELKIENQHKVNSLQLEKEVSVTGFINDTEVIENLLNLNVFVSTSSSEGFPNALLEAAALGVPIVVAGFEGIEDYCEHTKNVLIVPIGDVQATSDAITSILENRALAEKLSKGAMALAKSLTPAVEKKQWVELYKEQLETNFKSNLLNKLYV